MPMKCQQCRGEWFDGRWATTIVRACTEHSPPCDDGWLPIESAPKDGTEIVAIGTIVQDEKYGDPRRRACITKWTTPDRSSVVRHPCWPYFAPGYTAELRATHWRPLPKE